ncbi:MAG: ABC transporter ATP-binding protein [bacterium]
MSRILLKDIRKIYPNGFEAVHGINLEIKDGEFMVLVGPSGCAKSTTLRMIAGLEDIASGDLIINDMRVNDLPPSGRNVAMVFQDYALYPHMTVFDNMAYGLRIRRLPKSEIKKRVMKAAKILGLEEHLRKKPKALSGGQRQRVAVGRVIVREPDVFLFDEPLSNLDAKLRVHMRAEIIKIQKALGTTMVYVTHDQVEAMTMGDRICVMNAGHIMQVDEPMKIYDHPANRFVARFIGSPEMNMIRGKVFSEANTLFFEVGGTRFALPEEKRRTLIPYSNKLLEMGIRPEHIKVQRLGSREKKNLVKGEVSLVELMGNEKIFHFKVGKDAMICRSNPDYMVEKGKECSFVFDTKFSHFFEIDTGENVHNLS